MTSIDPRETAATFARAAGFDVDTMTVHDGSLAFAAPGAAVKMRGIKHTVDGYSDCNGRRMVDPDYDVWTCEVVMVRQDSGDWTARSVAAVTGFCN